MTTTAKKGTELTPFAKYAIAKADIERHMEIIRENTGGQITAADLTVVKMPSGGQQAFTIPSALGEDDIVKSIEGVIVYWQTRRAYWPNGLEQSGGGQPPVCFSADGRKGVGKPGGECVICPLGTFGPNGERPACKTMRPIYIVKPGSLLPMVIRASVTSIGPIQKYMLALASEKNLGYWEVITRLGLTEATARGGQKFSRLTCSIAGELSEKEREKLTAYRDQVIPLLNAAAARADFAAAADEDDDLAEV